MKPTHHHSLLHVRELKKKTLFPITPILINIIAIIILQTIYYYAAIKANPWPDYQIYIYWVVNILMTYNVLVASARSFIASILALLVAAAASVAFYKYNVNLFTLAETWQLMITAIVAFLISCFTKL